MKTIKNVSLQAICLLVKSSGGAFNKEIVFPNGIISIPDSAVSKQIEAYAIKRIIKIS